MSSKMWRVEQMIKSKNDNNNNIMLSQADPFVAVVTSVDRGRDLTISVALTSLPIFSFLNDVVRVCCSFCFADHEDAV